MRTASHPHHKSRLLKLDVAGSHSSQAIYELLQGPPGCSRSTSCRNGIDFSAGTGNWNNDRAARQLHNLVSLPRSPPKVWPEQRLARSASRAIGVWSDCPIVAAGHRRFHPGFTPLSEREAKSRQSAIEAFHKPQGISNRARQRAIRRLLAKLWRAERMV